MMLTIKILILTIQIIIRDIIKIIYHKAIKINTKEYFKKI